MIKYLTQELNHRKSPKILNKAKDTLGARGFFVVVVVVVVLFQRFVDSERRNKTKKPGTQGIFPIFGERSWNSRIYATPPEAPRS